MSSLDDLSDDDLPDIPLRLRIAAASKRNLDSEPLVDLTCSESILTSSRPHLTSPAVARLSSLTVPVRFEISSDEDDDDNDIPPAKKLRPLESATSSSSNSLTSVKPSYSSENLMDSVAPLGSSHPPAKSKPVGSGTILDKAEQRRRKEADKLAKKLEKEREAAERRLEARRMKAMKPGEAPKCIVVDLDPKLLETDFGGLLLQEIQTLGASTQIEAHPAGLSDTLFFWRTSGVEDEVADNDRTFEKFCLVYATAKEFVTLVAASRDQRRGVRPTSPTLREFITAKETKLKDVNWTFLVVGVEKHFRNVKTLQQKQYREKVRGKNSGAATSAWSDVTRLDVEESKIELQLFHGVHVLQVETKEEVSASVIRFTKSVAERPFKQMVQSRAGGLFSFCADSNAVCVKPNSLGEGLLKAWKKQLTQFTLVSDEVATAIVTAYPSPQLLRRAFKDNFNPQLLLKDLSIRRGTGPLESSRKVGPELSKRIHQFFSSTDGDEKIPM